MKLILTADVENLGGPGDTVEVKDGYGRNFLMPRGLAIKATRGAEKQVDSIRRAQQARSIRGLDHANEVKDEIAALGTVSLPVRAGTKGKLFGSVGAGDVAAAVKAAGGPTLDKRTVDLPREHIKTAGKYTVTVRLHPEVSAQFALEVTVAS